MTVADLKRILDEEYEDEAEVVVVNWSNGRTYEPSVGGDDLDEGSYYCRIGFE